MNPLSLLFYTHKTLAPTVLRLAFATLYLFHAGQKFLGLFGGSGLEKTWESMTSPEAMGMTATVATLVLLSEVLIPFFLLVGFAVRLVSMGIMAHMVAALLTVYNGLTFAEKEFPLFVMATALALLIAGAGSFSLDRKISRVLSPTTFSLRTRERYY